MNSMRIITALGLAFALSACGGSGTDETTSEVASTAPAATEAPAMQNVASVEIVPGLSMRMLREGSGVVAEDGQTAVVHYTGWLFDESAEANRGAKFESSVDRGQHFEFPLGGGRVIRGWDEGVVGMQVGEVRELTIAPEMAYGQRQIGALIPPNSTLVFEVELAGLKDAAGEAITAP